MRAKLSEIVPKVYIRIPTETKWNWGIDEAVVWAGGFDLEFY
jgi:hypothetical protein